MTSLRHLLLVTSASPDFEHSQAAQTVCALLAVAFAGLVPKVTIGLACSAQTMSPDTANKLAYLGVDCVTLPSRPRAIPSPVRNKLEALEVVARSVLLRDGGRDYPSPDDAGALAAGIDAVGADAVLLFWDTLAEFALPHVATPAFGYLARPPQAAATARVRVERSGLRGSVDLALLSAQSRRHFERMRRLRRSANICAIDAAYYTGHGVPCSYVPNCWADAAGAAWRETREHCESQFEAPQILGNIGALDATGNSFGLRYLGNEVLPVLSSISGDIDWTINICGPRRPSAAVASALGHPRIMIKGFVPDIDREIQSSAIFLLLNNAGPYTGGYTRVVYAFATGACLVAHHNLALSMPELRHDENCLLADTADGIAIQIDRALRDPSLRRRIGAAARSTYEAAYAPGRVADHLLRMIDAGLVIGEERFPSSFVREVAGKRRAAGGVS